MDLSLPAGLETLHLHEDAVPWLDFEPGVQTRVLHARPSENLIVTALRAQPNVVLPLHRHCGPVFAYTTLGSWGHDEQVVYRPGTYVYETPGVVHRFFSGPSVVEGLFISYGDVQLIDPETGETSWSATAGDLLAAYYQACEAAGVPRPNLLT